MFLALLTYLLYSEKDNNDLRNYKLHLISGANDVTVNPNRKSTPSGVLPPSPTQVGGTNPDGTPGGTDSNESSEIEMSLRLVCSMSGNRSKAFWEDVTDTTPMTVVLKNSNSVSGVGGALENKYNLSQANIVQDSSTAVDLRNPESSPGRTPYAGNTLNSIEIEDNSRSPGSVQFTSLVSAAFWLVYCPNWMSSDVISLVDQIYKVQQIKQFISGEDTRISPPHYPPIYLYLIFLNLYFMKLIFELDFLCISNLIFTACVACKNQVPNGRQKIKFKN